MNNMFSAMHQQLQYIGLEETLVNMVGKRSVLCLFIAVLIINLVTASIVPTKINVIEENKNNVTKMDYCECIYWKFCYRINPYVKCTPSDGFVCCNRRRDVNPHVILD